VLGALAFALLPAGVLVLLDRGSPVCFGYFLCLPGLADLGSLSAAGGLALAVRLYGEGYLALPDVR